MARTKKVYRVPLREDWAQALLSAPSESGPGGWSVAKRLEEAKLELRNTIGEALRTIVKNPLVQTVANAAAKEASKRGDPHIVIDADGTVMLEIHSKATTKKGDDTPTQVVDLKPGAKKSSLPHIDVLRTVAAELGIDTSKMGRAKKKIMAAIEAKREESQKKQTKRTKTAPSVTPVTVAADTGLTNGDDIFAQPAVDGDDLLPDLGTPAAPSATKAIQDADELDLDVIIKPNSP